MSQPAAVPCRTCGAFIDGRFCGACGEKRITARDYSVAHFVAHVFETSRFVWSSAMARRFLLFFVTLLTLH